MFRCLCVSGLVLASMLNVQGAASQSKSSTKLTDFSIPTASNEKGRQGILKGKSADRLPNGQLQITELNITMFRGQAVDMIIEAPTCIFDSEAGVASSPGEISVKSADGRFTIKGQGFRWVSANQHLFISNNVQTTLSKSNFGSNILNPTSKPTQLKEDASTGSKGNRATGRVDITSQSLDYSEAGAKFQGNVRAKDEDSLLTCGVLTVVFKEEAGKADQIKADENVVFEQANRKVFGDSALYNLKDEVVTLKGNARWILKGSEGKADSVIIRSSNSETQAEGNVVVTLVSGEGFSLDWFSSTNQARAEAQTVEIRADRLDYKESEAVFRNNVRVASKTGSTLKCEILTASFTGGETSGGKVTGLTAERSIEIQDGKTVLHCEKATYFASEELVTLTGNPNWVMEQGRGKSDLLIVYPKTQRMHAEGNVATRFTTRGAISFDFSLAQKPQSTNDSQQEIEIKSEELSYKPGSAIFVNQVQLTFPEDANKKIHCNVLATFFGAENKLEQIIAEENVEIEQEGSVAKGHRAVYHEASGAIELSGEPGGANPEVISDKRRFSAPLFVLNRKDNSVRLKGRYKIQMEAKSLRDSLEGKPAQ